MLSLDEKNTMSKTTTIRFDIAEHLRTPEEMAAYLETILEMTASSPGSWAEAALEERADRL